MRSRETALIAVVLVTACGAPPRFALRAPVMRDPDTLRVEHRPATRPDADMTWAVDTILLRPVSHALLMEPAAEARNVNALDEVPDSSWFTNRSPTPREAFEGACAEHPEAVPPFTVTSAKIGGWTPGFFVRDATGRRFVLKFDHTPERAPELSTAADAITSRLYWAIGYNTPCNRVTSVREAELRLSGDAFFSDATGAHQPFTTQRFEHTLALVPHARDGTMRAGLSEFLPGEPLGAWPVLGVREDDPNDRIPHEHRRELRGERLLAAWVNHWDARQPNAMDTYVTGPEGPHVAHWMLDFGDTLGGPTTDQTRQQRLGFSHVIDLGETLERMVTFGFYRPTWESLTVDPRAPTLGYFDVAHFDPGAWRPFIPLPRFDNAQDQDLAWMARRIARITPDHLSAMVLAGRFTDAATSARLLAVLIARRERALRWSFERTSPLASLVMRDAETVCAEDVAIESGMATAAATRVTAQFRTGAMLHAASSAPTFVHADAPAAFCIRLPHDAPETAPDESPARYAVLDLSRVESGHTTRLAAHLYDLGPRRGFVLVGIER